MTKIIYTTDNKKCTIFYNYSFILKKLLFLFKSTQHKLCNIIAGYLEYVTIEKFVGSLDVEKMELIKRTQEITKLIIIF